MSGPYRGQRGSPGQGQRGWNRGGRGRGTGGWRSGGYRGQSPPHQGPPPGQRYGQGPPHHGPPHGQFHGRGPPSHSRYQPPGQGGFGQQVQQRLGQAGFGQSGPPHGQYYGQGPPSHYQPPGHGGLGQHGSGTSKRPANPWQEAMRQQMESYRRQEQMTQGHQFNRRQPSSTSGPSSGRAIGSRQDELEGLPIQGTAQRIAAAASETDEPWTTGPWRTPSAEELAHRPPIEARRRNVSLPLHPHEMMSPAPPTDDPELNAEDRGVREMSNEMRNRWIRERQEIPQTRVEGLIRGQEFSKPHPFTPGLSIGGLNLGKLLATKQRMGTAKQLIESSGKNPTKEKENQWNQKWEKKRIQLELLESARQQSHEAERTPVRRRTISEQDVPQLTRSLSQLSLGQGEEPSRPRSMSTSAVPDLKKLFRSGRKYHPTKYPVDPNKVTDDNLRLMGVRSREELARLLPSAIERQFQEPIKERMAYHRPYMTREQNITTANRGLDEARLRSFRSVDECNRFQRQRQSQESARLPQTVGSLDPQRQPLRMTIHEARPGEEEEEERRTREERRRSRERRRRERESRLVRGEEVSDEESSSSEDEDQRPYFPQNWPPPSRGTGRRSPDRRQR